MTDPFAYICDYLPELEPWLRDESVSEIMINPDGKVFVERGGRLEKLDVLLEMKKVAPVVNQIASRLGGWVDVAWPLLESRLPDGSRVAISLPPASVGGISMVIRKFPTRRYSAQELVAMGAMTMEQMLFLAAAVDGEKNILISGGTGTGKTTMINAMAGFIPDDQRIILIEDVAEIVVPSAKENVTRFEARRATADMKAITIRDLLVHSLRVRPDRLILGEVRDAAAFELLQVLSSGHAGTLSTIHANSAARAPERLTSLALIADVSPPAAVRGEIATSLDLIVHVVRERSGRRRVAEILRMEGYNYADDTFRTAPVEFPERKPADRIDGVTVLERLG